MTTSAHIIVIGAGAFGGWIALHLQRAGARVTLLDAWGPGNSRSSSGGETRVIRHTYADRINTEMAAAALEQWKSFQKEQGRTLYFESGALFMIRDRDFEQAASESLRTAKIDFEILDEVAMRERFPQINPDECGTILFEPSAGYLMAREACVAVADAFVAEGGEMRVGNASPGRCAAERMREVVLDDAALTADAFVFACGPWLPGLFPEILGDKISVTRQEAYFFGAPADSGFDPARLPVWADVGREFWYGIPDAAHRGFKLANDTNGPAFDPTHDDRSPTADGVAAAREYLAFRFPGMRNAPLIESRVCQYSNTKDNLFLIDRLPGMSNVWIAGGGSGHGFKHGPVVGEIVAGCVLGKRETPPEFALSRLD